ncbi:MAG TPA: 2-dehydropantoate 2-reductase [Acetobacteraceae bacterium]|nr:2-dehydropantoate 2-reductase [Acetobacteraceae bacterium]
MKPRIAIMGTGAVGGYTGAHMAQAGEEVIFIDPWPAHVEAMREKGLRISHLTGEEFTVKVRALHLTDVQGLAKERPIDIAFVCVKSYDTEWATRMIAQYLGPNGFVVSLQNCMNEETIASVVGWGRTLGCIASSITVDLCEPGHVRRAAGKSRGKGHVVYRTGEVHGRITDRAKEVCRLVDTADGAMVTTNLWGERWSKLVTNAMGNGISACTGLISREVLANDALRRFSARLGSEAIRTGQALGYSLEEILHMDPEVIARAGEGDPEAARAYDDRRLSEVRKGGGEHRPSMGQDMMKGRRTEIEYLNGYVVKQAERAGLSAPANAALTDIVKRVERGELKPDPKHIVDLRLN